MIIAKAVAAWTGTSFQTKSMMPKTARGQSALAMKQCQAMKWAAIFTTGGNVSPRPRTKDKHLPPRVYIKHGAYWLVTLENKWIRLGTTFAEAMGEWTRLASTNTRLTTMGQLFDRYLLEVSPLRAKATHKGNQFAIAQLRTVFNNAPPDEVTPVHIYGYLDRRGKVAKRGANIERGVLSHVFTKAIEWGIVTDNPCKHVKRLKQKKRNRYVTDEEYNAVRQFSPGLIACAMEMAYLTGLRKADVLGLRLSDLTSEGISVTPRKTENSTEVRLIIEWSPALKECVASVKALPRGIRGLYLFCTRRGAPYSTDGFDSIWQRMIRRAFKEGIIQERFRFHDLRRKAATDAEKLHGREYARKLLAHATQSMTGNYISGVQRVQPVK